MKKVIAISLVTAVLLALNTAVFAGTITIQIQPSDVPDEELPRVNSGDAPTGFGPDSWQGPATGKTNWHARYLADGDALSALFPDDVATMTINDIASISYNTKRPNGTSSGRDWWVQIYTRPVGSGWYNNKFINNYNDHTSTDVWTEYSTDSGMTFNAQTYSSGEMTLAQLQANHGNELIEMISVQTDSGWDGFDGYMDGLVITLDNGNVGQVNFVPEPMTIALLGLGGLMLRRKK